jgi:hypothetical protein
MQPLASADSSQSQTNTNLSTSVSFSVLHQNGTDIPIYADLNQPIEIIIPRDPSIIIPPINFQNVTSLNPYNQSFYLHYNNLSRNDNVSISFHLEMHPLSTTLAYLFIYNFDQPPQLNKSINLMDGWSLFCPISKMLSF